MSPGILVRAALACAAALLSPCVVADASADRATVTALADRFVTESAARFPLGHAFSGLPVDRHDGVDVNAPEDIVKWHALLRELSVQLARIDPQGFAGEPEWVTWQFLNHAFLQDAGTELCRNELWSVSPFGWQASLPQVAAIQPVETEAQRAQALARWQKFGPWIEQEIANLRQGQREGYSATQASVRATLEQLDALLAGTPDKSPFMNPAERVNDRDFSTNWSRVIAGGVWPAIVRYRDYLRDEYLSRARQAVSIDGHPHGRECYRATIFSIVTLDADPDELFDRAVAEVAREQAAAVQLGRGLYGERASDWDTLAVLMREDPRNTFKDAGEVRAYTQRTYERANAAAGRMVLTPPVALVKLEPFPEFQQATAPGGQYVPAAQDGSRAATYLYRDSVSDLYRASLQHVILHETLPSAVPAKAGPPTPRSSRASSASTIRTTSTSAR
jgi:uncharacterized protein (DUF885 family)